MPKRLITEVISNEIIKLGRKHKGYMHERTSNLFHDLEKDFYNQWKRDNKPKPGINYGFGLLQDLFCIPEDDPLRIRFRKSKGQKIVINNRDKYVVATVIQWLGTNCGMAFLGEVLRKSGRNIVVTNHEKNDKRKMKI